MPIHETTIRTVNDPRGIQQATKDTLELNDAMGKLLERAKRKEEYLQAKAAIEKMSAEEREAALSAHRMAAANEKAAADTRKLTQASKDGAGGIAHLKNSWMEASAKMMIAQEVYAAGQQVFQATAGMVIDLAAKTRDLQHVTGGSAEEMSTLIAVADDMAIEYATLETAITNATRRGLAPNLEGIIQMGEEYRAIQDPFEQSRYLLDNFGKSGANVAELMKLSAAEIRAMGEEAAKTGQVLSEADMKIARDYEVALDNYKDSRDKFLRDTGTKVLPFVSTLLDAQSRYNASLEEGGKWYLRLPGISAAYLAILALQKDKANETAAAENNLNQAMAGRQTGPNTGQRYQLINGRVVPVNDNNNYSQYPTYAEWLAQQGAGHATGGPVFAGNAYPVNEPGAGPEVLVMGGQHGYVLSRPQAERALAGSGGAVIQLIYNPQFSFATQKEAERLFLPYVESALRSLGVSK